MKKVRRSRARWKGWEGRVAVLWICISHYGMPLVSGSASRTRRWKCRNKAMTSSKYLSWKDFLKNIFFLYFFNFLTFFIQNLGSDPISMYLEPQHWARPTILTRFTTNFLLKFLKQYLKKRRQWSKFDKFRCAFISLHNLQFFCYYWNRHKKIKKIRKTLKLFTHIYFLQE